MTRMPSRFSLVARLIPSVSHWIFLKRGTVYHMVTATTATRTTTAAAVAAVHSQFLPEILRRAHVANMGDFMTICRPLAVNTIR